MRKKLLYPVLMILIMVLIMIPILMGCTTNENENPVYTSVEDLDGMEVAVLSGAIFDRELLKFAPNAKPVYYNSVIDSFQAVQTGKQEAAVADGPVIRYYLSLTDDLSSIPITGSEINYGAIFRKNSETSQALCDQFNAFLKKINESGELEAIERYWMDEGGREEGFDFDSLPDTNGTITAAVVSTMGAPDVFMIDGQLAGFDMEILYRFCQSSGYRPTIMDTSFDALLVSVASGKADLGISCIAITDERSQSVLFSDPYYYGSMSVIIRSENAVSGENGSNASGSDSFANKIADSFEKTFILENRWKMFVNGIARTLLITVLSIIFGTLLGFALYMFCRSGGAIADSISRFTIWLIQGMPMVVLLMIFYYVIFGNTNLSGTWVAVICFTLSFGSAMFGMLRMGVAAIDIGQTEGARALGYNDRQAFFKIILPQATLHFLPAYRAEVVSLIKATAVVGYIAVQDLTKAGDIVRSCTYEAFFPLIATAIIYFILAGILTTIVRYAQIEVDPKRRSKYRILKGLKGGDKL